MCIQVCFFEFRSRNEFSQERNARSVLEEMGVPHERTAEVLELIRSTGQFVGIVRPTPGLFVAIDDPTPAGTRARDVQDIAQGTPDVETPDEAGAPRAGRLIRRRKSRPWRPSKRTTRCS